MPKKQYQALQLTRVQMMPSLGNTRCIAILRQAHLLDVKTRYASVGHFVQCLEILNPFETGVLPGLCNIVNESSQNFQTFFQNRVDNWRPTCLRQTA
ncbi:MAG: hypothetical protein LBT59_23265 [Clostridiales bacterium]|jgi:hypothetical protein|nr:hypothetical protein [Clostridiales bacterium]